MRREVARPPAWLTSRRDESYVHTLEELCVIMCRHASQADLDQVERWPLDLLWRRYAALIRVLERENEQLGD